MELIDALINGSIVLGFGYIAVSFVGFVLHSEVRLIRTDAAGRDVTELFGLWDDTDRIIRTAAKAMPAEAVLVVPVEMGDELEGLGIRELKKLASAAKIRGYSHMTKTELIEQLRTSRAAA